MAQTRADNLFWIFPLLGKQDPYSKIIDEPEKYFAKDEIVIPATFLESYKAEALEVMPANSFDDLRRNHQNTLQFVVIKEMDEPLGKGAFVGSQGLRVRALLLYSGIYGSGEEFAKLDNNQQIYLSEVDDNTYVNSRTMVNKTRYIQHLPELDEDKSFYERIKEPIAYANMESSGLQFYITLNETLYYIPVAALITKRVIQPHELLGFSYGSGYWFGINVTPMLLRKDGQPIDTVTIEVFESKANRLRFCLSREMLATFTKQRYIITDMNVLMMLPQYPNKLTVGKSNGACLPLIYYVFNQTKESCIGVVDKKEVVIFKMNELTNAQGLELKEFCVNAKINLMLLLEGNETKGMIPISDFVKLSLKTIKRVFERLNVLVSDKEKFKFVIVENKRMSKESVPVATQGLFGKKGGGAVKSEVKSEAHVTYNM